MNRMRIRIAQRLKESQNTCAMLTTFNEVDMSGIMAMRKKYKVKTHTYTVEILFKLIQGEKIGNLEKKRFYLTRFLKVSRTN